MKTVFSNYGKAITKQSLQELWMDLFKSADELLIATGYVSNDAVEELTAILQQNPDHICRLELLVGMHYLEGFTRPQYQSLAKLAAFLQSSQRGQVYVSPRMKFHGKLYAFSTPKKLDCLIGSANLSCFWDNKERTYETMLHIDESQNALNFVSDIKQVIDEFGEPINETAQPTNFRQHNVQLDEHLGVTKIPAEKINAIFQASSQYRFEIQMKCTEKSNLNVFFGEGRRNSRGFILPRPWYEVELIVSKTITSQAGYPQNRAFTVITDDGWQFSCKTSGNYSKNFRSENDLKILGKWIKGRLESYGSLQTGQMVTPEVLADYGNDKIELRSTDDENVWLLSFRGAK